MDMDGRGEVSRATQLAIWWHLLSLGTMEEGESRGTVPV